MVLMTMFLYDIGMRYAPRGKRWQGGFQGMYLRAPALGGMIHYEPQRDSWHACHACCAHIYVVLFG